MIEELILLVFGFLEKIYFHFIHHFQHSYKIILIYVSTPFVLLLLEFWLVGWEKSAIKRLLKPTGTALNDWVSFLLVNTGIHEIIGYGFLLGAAWYIPIELRKWLGYDLIRAIPSIPLQIVIFFVFIDFMDYWIHRFEHYSLVLWELHKYHHSSIEFNMITGQRVHPISDISIKRLVLAFPYAILGFPMGSFLMLVILRAVMSNIQHAKINWDLGWVGKYILISPKAHRIHHSKAKEHYNKNLGTIFVWWDKLFGTWLEPDMEYLPEIGIDEDELNHPNYLVNIWRSTRLAWNKLLT